MKRDDLPNVGSCCWAVFEHLYYIPGNASPQMEYCAKSQKVRSRPANWIFQNSRYWSAWEIVFSHLRGGCAGSEKVVRQLRQDLGIYEGNAYPQAMGAPFSDRKRG